MNVVIFAVAAKAIESFPGLSISFDDRCRIPANVRDAFVVGVKADKLACNESKTGYTLVFLGAGEQGLQSDADSQKWFALLEMPAYGV